MNPFKKDHRGEKAPVRLSQGLSRLADHFDFSLDKLNRPLAFTVLGLVAFGLVMVISSSSYSLISEGDSLLGYAIKQLIFVVIGLIMAVVFSSIDYHRLNWKVLFLAFPILLILNLLPKLLGHSTYGASRWIQMGPLSFQPSEITKYYVVAALAFLLSRSGDFRIKRNNYILSIIIIGIFGIIIAIVQSNLSTAAIMGLSGMTLILATGLPLVLKIAPFLMAIGAGAGLVIGSPYRVRRVLGFLDPFSDPTGDTLQVVQSFYALSMGGLLGRGLGNSRFKLGWLPFAENDFIFAIICEELGIIGALVVMLTFLFLVLTGIRIARQAKDRFGLYLALGISAVIGFQSAIHMAVVMGAFPVTGVPLPFISAGGTSMVVNLSAMGVLLNISKQGGQDDEFKPS